MMLVIQKLNQELTTDLTKIISASCGFFFFFALAGGILLFIFLMLSGRQIDRQIDRYIDRQIDRHKRRKKQELNEAVTSQMQFTIIMIIAYSQRKNEQSRIDHVFPANPKIPHLWFRGTSDSRTLGPSDSRTLGLAEMRTRGPSDQWEDTIINLRLVSACSSGSWRFLAPGHGYQRVGCLRWWSVVLCPLSLTCVSYQSQIPLSYPLSHILTSKKRAV